MARTPDLDSVATSVSTTIVEAELDDIQGMVTFLSGEAISVGDYQIGRDDSGTNVFVLNAPTGVPMQLAVDGGAKLEVGDNGVALSANLVVATRKDETAAITVTHNDFYIGSQYTATGTVAVTLTAVSGFADGFVFYLKDEDYNASVNNITVTPDGAEKINNAGSFVMNGDGESITVIMSNGAWHVI